MQSRRDRFRKQLELLEGAGAPRAAIEAGLYVPRPTSGQRLLSRIGLKPTATRVIAGPIGSGKSTELMRLEDGLVEAEDLWACVVDVSAVHDLEQLEEGTLIAAAGVLLAERFGDDHPGVQQLRSAAYGSRFDSTSRSLASSLSVMLAPKLGVAAAEFADPPRGLLRNPAARDQSLSELATALREVLFDIARPATPVLLFDSLDRVRDTDSFLTVLQKDAAALVQTGIGVVLTAPVSTLWLHSEHLRAHTESWDTLPYEDPIRDPRARAFMHDVLSRRSDAALLPVERQLELVHASGGVIRDLLELARNAVEEAYLDGREVVGAADVQASITRFARALSLGLDSNAIDVLLSVHATHRLAAFGAVELRLLHNRQLLEHDEPGASSYFEVHPTLTASLERWARAS